jgi:hypothetical protein
VEFEAVGGIAMSDVRLEIRRKVDDVDGVERALFHAYAASYAKSLRDERDLGLGCDLYAELAGSNDGT